MLEKNKTVDKERYLVQLHRVNEAIQQKGADRRGHPPSPQECASAHRKHRQEALNDIEWKEKVES